MEFLDPLQESILNLLSNSRLTIGKWKVKELNPLGRCSYKFILPQKITFLGFSFEGLETYDYIFRETNLRLKCDGILIDTFGKNLYFVEMKRHLSFPNFVKALNQLKASYLKLLSLLWLIGDFSHYEVKFFIITERIKKNFLEESYLWKRKILLNSQKGDILLKKFRKLEFFQRFDHSLKIPLWQFPVRRDILEKQITLKVLPCGGESFI